MLATLSQTRRRPSLGAYRVHHLFRDLDIPIRMDANPRGGRVDEEEAVEWGAKDCVDKASTSVATFIRRMAAAPRSTATLSPHIVAIAPSKRASAPIDR